MNGQICERYYYRCYDDIAVLYDKQNNEYVLLEDIFAEMFDIMMNEQDDQTFIVKTLLNEYDVDEDTLRRDVQDFYLSMQSLLSTPARTDRDAHLTNEYDESEGYIFALMTERKIPFTATIEITDRCNFKCVHCYRTQEAEDSWSIDSFEDTLQQLKALGTLHLVFAGSEPLMHSDIVDFIELAGKYEFVISIQTNAVLITPEIISAMDKCVVKNIFVSLYSNDKDIHDSITGQTGSYKATIDAVKRLVNSGYNVRASVSIFKNNKDQVRPVKNLCDELGIVPGYNFKIIPSLDQSKDTKALNCFNDDDMLQFIIDPELRLFRDEIKKCYEKTTEIPERYCDTGFRSITISFDQNVIICNSYRKNCGTIKENSIKEIWNNSIVLNEWRKIGSLVNAKCKTCEAYQFCEPCPAHQYSIDGDDSRIDDLTCQYGKMFFSVCQKARKTIDL